MHKPFTRKRNRLPKFDYAQSGAYFVTVCTQGRQRVFWQDDVATAAPEPANVETNVAAHSVRHSLPQPESLPIGAQTQPAIHFALLPPGKQFSPAGRIVVEMVEQIPRRYPAVTVDACAVMPNHVHLLLQIHSDENGRPQGAPTVSHIVKQWKEAVTKCLGEPLWQKSFHDHVIRGAAGYRMIWNYIDSNPATWRKDCFYIPIPKETFP